MTGGGFEPPPPKRTQLKCVALDHSAIPSKENTELIIIISICDKFAGKFSKKPPAGLEPAALRLKV